MALSVLDVYKILPRQNCGDCGYETCMAFAAAVIKEGVGIEGCFHLPAAAEKLFPGLKSQQKAGIGRKRLSIENALTAMHDKVLPLDFSAIAAGLNAAFGMDGETPFLDLVYFGLPYRIFKDTVRYPPEADNDPWDAVLLYNFVCSQGSSSLAGKWISMKDLPNSVSKAADIKELQTQLAAWGDGHFEKLLENAEKTGGTSETLETRSDAAIRFQPLAKTPVLLIFYKSDPAEGFAADAQFLFDASIVNYLDMESTVFLTERLVQKLTSLPFSRRSVAHPAGQPSF